jgi:hypothetical protein
MLSRNGQTSPEGKLTCRLDIPLSEELHDLIVVQASQASKPKAEFARDTLARALTEPVMLGLPEEVCKQLSSLAQMAGTSPSELALQLLADVVREKFDMAKSLMRRHVLGQADETPGKVGDSDRRGGHGC